VVIESILCDYMMYVLIYLDHLKTPNRRGRRGASLKIFERADTFLFLTSPSVESIYHKGAQ
jgi:hypothetical protein